jgi:hypothetical protein
MDSFFDSLRLTAIITGAGVVLLTFVPFVWGFIRQKPRLAYLLKLGMLSAATFAVVFFISSPFNVFSVRSGFMRGFLYESLHSSFGHGFKAENNKLEWFGILSSRESLDPFTLGLSTVGLVLAVYRAMKRGWRQLLEPESVMWIWTLYYLAFLVWRVNIRTHRALLPIIPFLAVFAAYTVSRVVHCAGSKLFRGYVAAVAIVSLLIVIGSTLPRSLVRILEFRELTGSREETSDAVLAGHWLEGQYPVSTRILYDPYSYVPPVFADAHVTSWGGTLQMIETLEPDVVIINDQNSDRFADIQRAAAYDSDESNFLARYDYYQALRREEIGYVLVRDFGDTQIYARD